MKKPIFALVLLVAMPFAPVGLASWVAPPEHVVEETRSGDFFIRKINSKSLIEIRNSENLGVEWEATIEDYSPLFSKLELSPDSNHLVHVKGNHMVRSISQVAVDVYKKDGSRDSYHLEEFLDELPAYERRFGDDPGYFWIDRISITTNKYIVIGLGEERYAWFSLIEHKVEIRQ